MLVLDQVCVVDRDRSRRLGSYRIGSLQGHGAWSTGYDSLYGLRVSSQRLRAANATAALCPESTPVRAEPGLLQSLSSCLAFRTRELVNPKQHSEHLFGNLVEAKMS